MKDYDAFMFGAYEENYLKLCKWVSVKNRQPEDYGIYLTYYHEQIHLSKYIGGFWYNEWGGDITNIVKYWRNLPEPPKQ